MKKITLAFAAMISAAAFAQTPTVLFNFDDVVPAFEFCFDPTDPDECTQGRVTNDDQTGANTSSMSFQGQTGTTGGDFSNGFGFQLASPTTLDAGGTFFTMLFRSDNNPTGDLSIQAQFINNPDPDDGGGSIRGELFSSYTMTDGSWQLIEFQADPSNFQGGFDTTTNFARINFFIGQGAANGFSYGIDEGALTEQSVLSNNTTGKSKVLVWPNPSTNVLHIIGGDVLGKKIEILDVQGKVISEEEESENVNLIDISSLSKGIYFLKIDNANTIKFVKS